VEADTCILAKLQDDRIVAAQQGRLLATAFHPELTRDDRFHRYFLQLAA
jgi:5'-phosphate synthase pdxT subunit